MHSLNFLFLAPVPLWSLFPLSEKQPNSSLLTMALAACKTPGSEATSSCLKSFGYPHQSLVIVSSCSHSSMCMCHHSFTQQIFAEDLPHMCQAPPSALGYIQEPTDKNLAVWRLHFSWGPQTTNITCKWNTVHWTMMNATGKFRAGEDGSRAEGWGRAFQCKRGGQGRPHWVDDIWAQSWGGIGSYPCWGGTLQAEDQIVTRA